MKDTYSNRLADLNETFAPNRFFVTDEEIEWVRKILKLEEMETELELRNMRDMAVMWFTIEMKSARYRNDNTAYDSAMVKQSATVAVIDRELWNRGFQV